MREYAYDDKVRTETEFCSATERAIARNLSYFPLPMPKSFSVVRKSAGSGA